MVKNGRLLLTMILMMMLTICAGIALPFVAYGSLQVSSGDVAPPGIAVQDTPFASLVSNETDPVVYHAEYHINSTEPLTLTATFDQDNSSIDIETAVENALRFIEEPIRNYLQSTPRRWELSTNVLGFPILSIWFDSENESSLKGVFMQLNPISGRVVRYMTNWVDSPFDPPLDLQIPFLNPDGHPANTSQIQSVLADFLSYREYTLPTTMRLLRVTGYPNNSLPNTYKVELVDSISGVVPPDLMSGITAILIARTGRVLGLEYSCLRLPELPATQVKKPQLVYESFLLEDSSLSNYLMDFEYKGSYLQLVPIEWNRTFVRMHLQLGWTLRLVNANETWDEYELQRDAFDGTELEIESPYYKRYAMFQWRGDEPILYMPFLSLGVATVVYFVARRFKTRWTADA